jgi:hypothetical protein
MWNFKCNSNIDKSLIQNWIKKESTNKLFEISKLTCLKKFVDGKGTLIGNKSGGN